MEGIPACREAEVSAASATRTGTTPDVAGKNVPERFLATTMTPIRIVSPVRVDAVDRTEIPAQLQIIYRYRLILH